MVELYAMMCFRAKGFLSAARDRLLGAKKAPAGAGASFSKLLNTHGLQLVSTRANYLLKFCLTA